MKNFEERHKIKFLRIFDKELNSLKKPVILEFGVSKKALSTSIFLKICEDNNGFLYSVDIIDYSYHFKSENWRFIHSKDDNYDFIDKQIPLKFDIIYLDTLHTAKHVEKILYHYFDRLNVGGVFVIDDTSHLPYLKNREKNNFSLEVNNHETFQKLLEIYNSNHENLYFEASFIGTGAVKLTKRNENQLKRCNQIFNRSFSFLNLIRKIYLKLRKN
tara:strand:- start:1163 stop:1810 length:648 start_codon:yes stop_codon:yes gene_type:complete